MLNSIKAKVTIIIIISGILSIILQLIYSNISKEKLHKEEIEARKEFLLHSLNEKIDKKLDIALTNVMAFSANHAMKEALEENNREIAIEELATIGKLYQENTNFNGIKVHIHTEDMKSFVRSWDVNRYGDDLSSFRFSIKNVKSSKKVNVLFELGKHGLFIRAIAPIVDSGKYIGSIEFMQGVGSVNRDFKKVNREYIMLLNSRALEIATKAESNEKIKDFVVANDKWFADDTVEFAKSINYEKLFKDGYLITPEHFVTFEYVRDFRDEVIGIHLVGESISILNRVKDIADRNLNISLVISILSMSIMVILILIAIGKLVVVPIDNLKSSIKEIVESKDFSKIIESSSKDEISEINSGINILLQTFKTIFIDIKTLSDKTSSISQELAATSEQVLGIVQDEVSLVRDSVDSNSNMQTIFL